MTTTNISWRSGSGKVIRVGDRVRTHGVRGLAGERPKVTAIEHDGGGHVVIVCWSTRGFRHLRPDQVTVDRKATRTAQEPS